MRNPKIKVDFLCICGATVRVNYLERIRCPVCDAWIRTRESDDGIQAVSGIDENSLSERIANGKIVKRSEPDVVRVKTTGW